jgi:tetratricopeptide (TPR) repeat protein
MKRHLFVRTVGLFLWLALVLSGAGSSRAQTTEVRSVEQVFGQANAAYKEGRYDAAIEDDKKIIATGFESGNLYYNLGNSYFKKGEMGQAVLNYERALGLIPHDSDARSNYGYVLSSMGLSPALFGNRFERLAQRLFEGLAMDALTVFLSVSYILIVLVLIGFLYIPGFKKTGRIILVVLAVLLVLSAVSLNRRIRLFRHGAIVITKEAKAQFEPVEGATTYFKLAEGQKVETIEESGNWFKVRRPDGKTGWVDKSALGALFP